MSSEKLHNSAKSLCQLYTVIVGVALSMSVRTLVGKSDGILAINWISILLFWSFIVTIVPFYHGALRHIDDEYIADTSGARKVGALIYDFLLLLLHGLTFVVLSLLIDTPNQFAWVLIAVLAIDVAWGLFVHFASSNENRCCAEGKWATINGIFVVLGAGLLFANDIFLGEIETKRALSAYVAIGCSLRTVADYKMCWGFYFPDSN